MVRPGITGWAQVRYRYANNLEEEIEKMRYDLYTSSTARSGSTSASWPTRSDRSRRPARRTPSHAPAWPHDDQPGQWGS
jgi:hypothetical protein